MRRGIFESCFIIIMFLGMLFSVVIALDISAKSIGADLVWNQGITGAGVRIAVLDSGIYASHPALTNKINMSIDFTGEGPDDLNGHGTHVAGIIASTNATYNGTAYGCQLINVKIADYEGNVDWTWYKNGVEWCINNKNTYNIRVISFSGGWLNYACDGECQYCKKAEDAIEAGITFVTVSGNDFTGLHTKQAIKCPGSSFNTITVGACDDYRTIPIADDNLSKYSCRGPTMDQRHKPDVLAPGDEYYRSAAQYNGIWSCAIPKPKDPYDQISTDKLWGRMTGTSMAVPHVSGTVALMLQANPNLTPAQIKAILRQTAILNNNLSALTLDDRGYGIVNASRAVYIAQHVILINASLTFDEYHVKSMNLTMYGGLYRRSMDFNVNRTSYGIDLKNVMIDEWWHPFDPDVTHEIYEIFGSIKTPYVWINGSISPLGLYQYLLQSGPRVSSLGEGKATIRATYKIGDVTAVLNYFVNVSSIQPWVNFQSSTSHTYKNEIYLDANLRGSPLDYATYTTNVTITNEIKLLNTEIYARDKNKSYPYLDLKPYYGSPYTWILKQNGQVYDNPDQGLNSENINGADIVLYYQYGSNWPGPYINIGLDPTP